MVYKRPTINSDETTGKNCRVRDDGQRGSDGDKTWTTIIILSRVQNKDCAS